MADEISCVIGKDNRRYYFRRGRRISAQVVIDLGVDVPCETAAQKKARLKSGITECKQRLHELEELKGQNTHLVVSTQGLQRELHNCRLSLTRAGEEIRELRAMREDVEDCTRKLALAEGELRRVSANRATSETARQDCQIRLDQCLQKDLELATANELIGVLHQNIARLTQENELYQAQLVQQGSASSSQVNQLGEVLRLRETELKELTERWARHTKLTAKMTVNMEKCRANHLTALNKINDLQRAATAMNKELSRQREQYEQELTRQIDRLNQASATKLELEGKSRERIQQLEEETRARAQRIEECSENITRLESVAGEYHQCQVARAECLGNLESCKRSLEEVSAGKEELKSLLASCNSKNVQCEARVTSLEAMVAHLRIQLDKTGLETKIVQKTLESARGEGREQAGLASLKIAQQAEELKEVWDKYEMEINYKNHFQSESKAYQNQVQLLAYQVNEQAQTITHLSGTLQGLQQAGKDVETQRANLAQATQAIEAERDNFLRINAQQQKDLETNREQLALLAQELTDLRPCPEARDRYKADLDDCLSKGHLIQKKFKERSQAYNQVKEERDTCLASGRALMERYRQCREKATGLEGLVEDCKDLRRLQASEKYQAERAETYRQNLLSLRGRFESEINDLTATLAGLGELLARSKAEGTIGRQELEQVQGQLRALQRHVNEQEQSFAAEESRLEQKLEKYKSKLRAGQARPIRVPESFSIAPF